MSPLQLSICIHYHSSVDDMCWVRGDAPIRDRVVDELMEAGLLETGEVGSSPMFRPAPKLHAFIAMLCATPLPVNPWCDPRTGEKLTGHGIPS